MNTNKEFTTESTTQPVELGNIELLAELQTAWGLLQLYANEINGLVDTVEKVLPQLPAEQAALLHYAIDKHDRISMAAFNAAVDKLDDLAGRVQG